MVNTMKYFHNFLLYFSEKQMLSGNMRFEIQVSKYQNIQKLPQINIQRFSFSQISYCNLKRKRRNNGYQCRTTKHHTSQVIPEFSKQKKQPQNNLYRITDITWASMSASKILSWLEILWCVNLYLSFKERKRIKVCLQAK